MICEKCKVEHEGVYGSGRFCSEKCARSFATFAKRKEINEKVSKKLTKGKQKYCKKCKAKVSHNNKSGFCKICKPLKMACKTRYEIVKEYRKRTKQKAVEYKGGKCIVCGYNRCFKALEFHHINSETKDFSISRQIRSWEMIEKELNKCIMVCANCHREIENNLINIKEY